MCNTIAILVIQSLQYNYNVINTITDIICNTIAIVVI